MKMRAGSGHDTSELQLSTTVDWTSLKATDTPWKLAYTYHIL